MKSVRILHFADLHVDDSTLPNSLAAAWEIVRIAESKRPDLIVNAGDLAMRRGHMPPWVAWELRKMHARLSEVAPVVVVEGNHDMVHDDRAGTVLGALDASSAARGRLALVTKPEVVAFPGVEVAIACLPYPSRKRLLAGSDVPASEANARIAEMLKQIADGLAVECAEKFPGWPAILVFHGTLDGAQLGDERLMTTEMDALLSEPALPPYFRAILCGHIHKPQEIGTRAAYAGSPAPLGFSEESYAHGVRFWTLGEALHESEMIEVEPARRLLTLDYRGLYWRAFVPDEFPPNTAVRVLLELGREENAAEAVEFVEREARRFGAVEVKVVIERRADGLDSLTTSTDRISDRAHDAGALMELYAERSPEAHARLHELKLFAEVIEAGLPPEARNARNAAEYTLESIEVSNWKSYGPGPQKLDLEALGRLTVIEGDNASGKSNLMEAEAFALWGRTIRGRQTLDELVRKGATDATVSAVFRSAGERWKVTRSIRLRTNGTGAADLILMRMGTTHDGAEADQMLAVTWVQASGGSASETEAKIEALVGTLDLYLSTRFASQGDVDRILSLTPAELKDTVQEALNTSLFTYREAAGLEVLRERMTELTKAEAAREAAEANVRPLEDLNAELERAEAAQHEANDNLAAARDEETVAQQAAGAAHAARKDLGARIETFRIARETLGNAERAMHRMGQLRGELQQQIQIASEAKGTAERIERLRVSIGQLEAATATQREQRWKANELRKWADKQSAELSNAENRKFAGDHSRAKELREAEQARDRSRKLMDAHVQSAETSVTELRMRLSSRRTEVEARAKSAERAPFGEKCIAAQCPMLHDATKAVRELREMPEREAKEIAEAEARVVQMKEQRHEEFEAGERALQALRARHVESFEADTAAIAEAGKASRAAREDAESAEALAGGESSEEKALREARATVAECDTPALRDAVTRGGAAELRMASLAEDEQRAADQLLAAQKAMAALGEEPDAMSANRAVVEADRVAADKAAVRAEFERKRDQCGQEIAKVRAAITAAEAAAVEVEHAKAREEAAVHAESLVRLYLMAVGKNGLPYMVLERALPALEKHANAFLGAEAGDVDLRVEIEPFRTLASGERRTDVVVRYRNGYGTHALAAASGFERAALGYALRAAMAQIQAEAHGIKVTHFVADEGWGAFDERNLLLGQRMLQRMADEFRRVIYISHVGTIREIADSRVAVTADHEHGAKFEVLA